MRKLTLISHRVAQFGVETDFIKHKVISAGYLMEGKHLFFLVSLEFTCDYINQVRREYIQLSFPIFS